MLSKIKSYIKNRQNLPQFLWITVCLMLVFGLGAMRSNDTDLIQPNNKGASSKQNNPGDNNFDKDAIHDSQKTNGRETSEPKAQLKYPSSEQRAAHQDYKISGNLIIASNGQKYPIRTYKTLSVPNDTYANQWWVSPTTMDSAWSVPAGAKQVKIGIIDTGFGLNHQDLTGRWATNSGESGATSSENPSYLNCTDRSLPLNKSCNNIDDDLDGIVDNESGSTTDEQDSTLNCTDQSLTLDKSCNMIDDDGNGYVDDYRGWDFANYDRSVAAGETNPDGSGTHHGTMTSGILGATGNNNVGIAGVNWHAEILPIQAMDDDSFGNTITVANAVYYAVDQGVDLISMSLGTSGEDPYLRQAIFYAQEHGVLVVAASGNDGCNCIVYPANYPEVFAVGSSNSSGSVSSFSSYGTNLDIVAPGEDMLTTYWTKNNKTSLYVSGADGTSFSTPFVAGALGLLRSYQPDASWDEITGILLENSDRKSLSNNAIRSNSYGFGFIKVNQSLSRTENSYSPVSSYGFFGDILGTDRIRQCDSGIIPATYLYQLTKSGQIKYTINHYEVRKAQNTGWSASTLLGVCVGLPTDTPDLIRLININLEIKNQLIK